MNGARQGDREQLCDVIRNLVVDADLDVEEVKVTIDPKKKKGKPWRGRIVCDFSAREAEEPETKGPEPHMRVDLTSLIKLLAFPGIELRTTQKERGTVVELNVTLLDEETHALVHLSETETPAEFAAKLATEAKWLYERVVPIIGPYWWKQGAHWEWGHCPED